MPPTLSEAIFTVEFPALLCICAATGEGWVDTLADIYAGFAPRPTLGEEWADDE